MARSPRLTAAARQLKPLRQGDLDKFCGLYAIINGVRLALHGRYRFTQQELETLLVHGLRHLARGRAIMPVAARGMTETAWLRLCDVMLAEVQEQTGIRVARMIILARLRQPDIGRAVSRIGSKLRRGHPVVVSLWGALDHFTVAIATTDATMQLFDSCSISHIRLSSLGLGGGSRRRHRLSRRGVVALIVERAPDTERGGEHG